MRAAVIAFAVAVLVMAPVASFSKAAPRRDWSTTVIATPEGGFQMGNPAAKVKLVEYGSLACPHCRHFEETGYAPLVRNYVSTGRISYEFRNVLLNAPDIAASMLVHCAGPTRFFRMSKAVYDAQPQWFGRVQAISDAHRDAIAKMSDSARMVRLAEIAGFVKIAARFGMTPTQTQRCLADGKGLQRLLNRTQAAQDAGITRTPTFLIDGDLRTLRRGTSWMPN